MPSLSKCWPEAHCTNEPADLSSYFAARHHGTGRAVDAGEQGNDGRGSIGVCPHCQIVPIRIWDTFVSDANTFALGVVYATDNGVKVIEGANGSLYHSAFAEAASQYAYDHGVVQTFSGDDLNTGNHNYPANYGHAMLIQGTVPDSVGVGQESSQWVQGQKLCGLSGQPACLGSNAPVGTFFRGANTTQFGNGARIAPTARIDDGLLDLVTFEERSRLSTLWGLPSLFTGNAERVPGVLIRKVTGSVVESSTPMLFHVDGEPVQGDTRLEARIHEGVLKVAAGELGR